MLGSAVKQDLEKSRYWFHKLEQHLQSLQDERKDNPAFSKMHEMGLIASELAEEFESGVVVPKDLSRAFRFYLQAAEAGNSGMHERLARMYERGEGTEQNLAKAFEFFLKVAKYPGGSENTERVADMYLEGRGVNRNLQEAFKWLHQAAEWPTPSRLCKLAKIAREVRGKRESYEFGYIALFLFERRLVELNENMDEEERTFLGNLRVAREEATLSKNMPECLSFVLNVKKELPEEEQRDVEKDARTWMKGQLGFERGGFLR
jgi:TPR repeat protein